MQLVTETEKDLASTKHLNTHALNTIIQRLKDCEEDLDTAYGRLRME